MAKIPAVSANLDLTEQAYTRLHISPFNPALFTSVISPALKTNVRNISYHSLQTFPEKDYGYLELPTTEAQQVKKKLHGSILKGSKMRIEDARPDKRVEMEDVGEVSKRTSKKSQKPNREPKRVQDTILAAELRDRKVKRGWTDPTPAKRATKRAEDKTEKKEGIKSKYTSDAECLFKTKVPPNMAGAAQDRGGKDRKRGRFDGKPGETVVVHEFERTTKYPTFLKENKSRGSGSTALEFVDDRGWVDQDGHIIEPVKIGRKRSRSTNASLSLPNVPSSPVSAVTGKVANTADVKTNTQIMPASASSMASDPAGELEESEGTSASKTSSDEESDSSDTSSSTTSTATGQNTSSHETTIQRAETSSGSVPSLKIMVPSVHEVHPLEALYKRRKADDSLNAMSIVQPAQTFNFFGSDELEEVDDDAAPVPMTPFTQHDFSSRNIRSAAPTPDTAHPDKNYFNWPSERDDDDEVDADVQDKHNAQTPSKVKADGKSEDSGAAVTDFSKWFYENRGDLNRSWKKRRKVAAKDKRQRENRKRGEQRT